MSTFYTEPTSGTRIATDVIGTDRYQIMKLDIGALGTTVPLTGSILDDSQSGAGMIVPRFGAMQHVYNAASDVWTRLRSANNLTDNFAGGTAPGTVIAGKNAAGNFDLLREVDAASGSTGRGILSVAPVGLNAGVFQPLQLDSNNYLSVVMRPASSTVNSSATPLASSAVFTGTGEDISAYSTVQVNVYSDKASATDGMQLQWSQDNTNWNLAETYTVTASGGQNYISAAKAQFFRVVYTNGTIAQTVFRLETLFSRSAYFAQETEVVHGRVNYNGLSIAVNQVQITATAAGNTTIVSAVAGKKIRVLAAGFRVASIASITWKSTGGSSLTPAMAYDKRSFENLNFGPHGYLFETLLGEGLQINLDVANTVSGLLSYILVS